MDIPVPTVKLSHCPTRRRTVRRPRPVCVAAFLSLFMVFAFTITARGETASNVNVTALDGHSIEFYQDYHALVVGVEHYEYWPAKADVLQNARKVSLELKRLGFSVRLLPDPTAVELRSALNEFAQTSGKNPLRGLVFYYAGNGQIRTTAAGKKTGWIIPKDAPMPAHDQQGFEDKAIRSAQFLALADQIQSKHVLFLFDAPFPADEFQVETPVLRTISDEDALPARQFITSGADEKPHRNQNEFVKYLLLGLQGEADLIHNSVISGSELGLYLSDRVAKVTSQQWHPQFGRIPIAAENKGDFIFKVLPQAQSLAQLLIEAQPFTNSLGMQFQPIRQGSFMMGSPPNEPGRLNDETLHRVTLTNSYFIQSTEVTAAQFKQFVRSTDYTTEAEKDGGCWVTGNETGWKKKSGTSWKNPGLLSAGDDLPVVCVTWNDARAFARWLSAKEGRTYRLPTEAEWEYAGRAGTSTPFSTGYCLSTDEANYGRLGTHDQSCAAVFKHQRNQLVKAGILAPNPWKLHNIHGNVCEWCLDWYGPYPSGSLTDPKGPASGTEHVMRGGHWLTDAAGCRCARRWRFPPNLAADAVGFRLVVVP